MSGSNPLEMSGSSVGQVNEETGPANHEPQRTEPPKGALSRRPSIGALHKRKPLRFSALGVGMFADS